LRSVGSDKTLSKPHRDRFKRLVSDNAEPAWRDTGTKSKRKWSLSEDELYTGQFLLASVTYRVPDFLPIGHLKAGQSKARLIEIGTGATKLANEIRKVREDDQLVEAYLQRYRNNRWDDEFLQRLPNCLSDIAKALDYIGNFFESAASIHKPDGPRLTVVQQPDSAQALKRTVILHIGGICRDYYRAPMYSTIARLASLHP
jgi:hypothetical protein